jgi:hypothetical protein
MTEHSPLDDSPYQPPVNPQADIVSREADLNRRELLPFAQLGLRLLGIMFVVDGLGALCGGMLQGLLQAYAYTSVGYDVPIDPHSVGWVAGGVPHLLVGSYFIVSGDWILQNIFMSSGPSKRLSNDHADEEDDWQ